MKMKEKILKLAGVTIFTCIIGILISYITYLFPMIFVELSFLESIGVYCILAPMDVILNDRRL